MASANQPQAEGSLPDADNTAKAIAALLLMGKKPSVKGLIDTFERRDHFATYVEAPDADFTVNCNVMTCLLMVDDPCSHVYQVAKIARFVTATAFKGKVQEMTASSSSLPNISYLDVD